MFCATRRALEKVKARGERLFTSGGQRLQSLSYTQARFTIRQEHYNCEEFTWRARRNGEKRCPKSHAEEILLQRKGIVSLPCDAAEHLHGDRSSPVKGTPIEHGLLRRASGRLPRIASFAPSEGRSKAQVPAPPTPIC